MNNHIWLRDAAEQLASIGIASALLDAEIILAHTRHKSRTWLHAHGDDILSERELDIANARLSLRIDRTPIAYIVGHKEFYGRLFKVTPSVLIPRPETEELISVMNTFITHDTHSVVDVGTGSGCIGITIKLEHPHLEVLLTDTSNHALRVAKENAARLGADVSTAKSSLMSSIRQSFDIITANLPYVDEGWEVSPETQYEPSIALFAGDHGLSLIKRLLDQSKRSLAPHGIIFIECDKRQHESIIAHATTVGLNYRKSQGLILVFSRDAAD